MQGAGRRGLEFWILGTSQAANCGRTDTPWQEGWGVASKERNERDGGKGRMYYVARKGSKGRLEAG